MKKETRPYLVIALVVLLFIAVICLFMHQTGKAIPLFVIACILVVVIIYQSLKDPDIVETDAVKYNSKSLSVAVLHFCSEFIEEYGSKTNSLMEIPCDEILMSAIKNRLDSRPDVLLNTVRDQMQLQSDVHIEYVSAKTVKVCASMYITNTSFDLLSSGNFHMYAGQLNPMGPATNLMRVYKGTRRWQLQNGYITQQDIEEEYHLLEEMIRDIG